MVTRKQLLDAEISSSVIDERIEKGLLVPEYRGVYRIGHVAPSTEATYMAAVLAAGKRAALSGQAAGHLMKLLKGVPPPPEVTAPTERRIKEVETKRDRRLDHRDIWVYDGIPCTTVARTLVDLAAILDEDDLARAVHEASVRYRTTPKQIEAVLARRPKLKGSAALRRILRGDTTLTLSKLEKRFLELLRENNLELPETNERIDGRFVDCRWPERKLTIELDSYRYHATRHAWEQDRKREREARKRGDDFRRFTWGDVFEEPEGVLEELRPILS
jgi:very-short-patch-repair endonuclease